MRMLFFPGMYLAERIAAWFLPCKELFYHLADIDATRLLGKPLLRHEDEDTAYDPLLRIYDDKLDCQHFQKDNVFIHK